MCRPVGVFWAEACPGGHIGPPLREAGRCLGTNGNWRGTGASRGGAEPAPYRRNASGAQHQADVGIGPYGTKRKPVATAQGSALSAEREAGQIQVLPDG